RSSAAQLSLSIWMRLPGMHAPGGSAAVTDIPSRNKAPASRRDQPASPYLVNRSRQQLSSICIAASAKRSHHFFFRGTRLPFLRAFDSPMAIACLRLFTLPPRPPLPLLAVPRL